MQRRSEILLFGWVNSHQATAQCQCFTISIQFLGDFSQTAKTEPLLSLSYTFIRFLSRVLEIAFNRAAKTIIPMLASKIKHLIYLSHPFCSLKTHTVSPNEFRKLEIVHIFILALDFQHTQTHKQLSVTHKRFSSLVRLQFNDKMIRYIVQWKSFTFAARMRKLLVACDH